MKNSCNILIALLISVLLLSCSKDDDNEINSNPVKAQLFESTAVMENSSTLDFKITLDKPATANGFVTIEVNATREGSFETNPPVIDGKIVVPVQKGQSMAILEFSPINNNLLQENAVVSLEIVESSEEIIFGSRTTSTIEITDDEAPVSASFQYQSLSVVENNSAGVEVRLVLSAPAPGEGSIIVNLQGNDNNYFADTYPALNAEQNIVIPIEQSTLFITFQVYPKDNSLLQNHKELLLNIVGTNGVVNKGDLTQLNLLVLDDEIQGKIKSVETITTNGSRNKKTWEYSVDGKVSKVRWENEPSDITQRVDEYFYESNGLLTHIGQYPGDGESFYWQNGKVVESEKISGFFKVGYTTYAYNSAAQIEKKIVYQVTNGVDVMSERYDYEYFPDGNLKKESFYTRGNNNDWVLDSSLSFDSYTNVNNPAPVEIIPTQKVQQYLPLYYTKLEHGVSTVSYYYYTFNSENMVTKKTSLFETVNYSYY